MITETKPAYNTGLTPEEYLVREEAAEYKSDYLYGEIRAMAGASPTHGSITVNLTVSVGGQLLGKPCRAYSSDVKIAVDLGGMFVYPDLFVVCGKRRVLDGKWDVITNPTVIFEILSPSTESYDRGRKATRYREMPSLQEYVFISQSEPRVERWTRQADEFWLLSITEGLEGSVRLESIGCTVAMADLYNIETPDDTQGE